MAVVGQAHLYRVQVHAQSQHIAQTPNKRKAYRQLRIAYGALSAHGGSVFRGDAVLLLILLHSEPRLEKKRVSSCGSHGRTH